MAPRSWPAFPYAERILDQSRLDASTIYALLLTAIAIGSIVGGLAVGAIGERFRKGPIIIAGFIGMGLSLAAAGLVRDPFVAIGLFSFVGLFNMLFIIPTITLFQQRTPQVLMGRVVSSRQALVFGAIALSMGLSGWMAEQLGANVVLVIAGAASAPRRGRWACSSPPCETPDECYPSRAVGLILDLAVVVLAGLVIVSLAILAWTIAVSLVAETRAARERVAEARASVAESQERIRASAARASATLAELAAGARTEARSGRTGDIPDR